MDFRRGASDERRRRVLIDEAAKERDEEASEPRSSKRAAVRPYSEGAVSDKQPRITDLLPTRLVPLSILALALMAAPAAITVLGQQLHARGLVQNSPALAAFDLTQRGNVAEWFTSLLLAGGALLSLAIFSIRRHRTDDYQGQYRMWLVVAAALLAGSLDASVHLREAFGYGVTRLSGQVLLGRPSGWWLLGYLLVGGALAVRVALEVFRSKSAAAMLVLTVIAFGTLAANLAGVAFSADPATALVIRTSLVFASCVSLVLMLACYARYVHHDAQGLIVAARRKKAKAAEEARKKAKAAQEEKEAAQEAAASADEAKPAPAKAGPLAGKSPALKPAAPPADEEEEEFDDDDEQRSGGRLSKAERKRLKRMQSQQPSQSIRRAA